jgi:uroporphyrinogen decarboxylase
MKKDLYTSKERWEIVLRGGLPDRVPMDYWGTPEITQKIMQYFQTEDRYDLARKLHIDLPYSVYSTYVGPQPPADHDIFGIRYRTVNYGLGTYREACHAPLAEFTTVDKIKASYQWPLADWWNTSTVAEQVEKFSEQPLVVGGSEPMLLYKNLRGEAQAMMDLALNPDIAHYCLGKLFDLAYQNTLRIYEALPKAVTPTYTYVAEDLGGQKNLMYSPKHIKEFLFPGMKRMIDLTHDAGAYVFHHNDGNVSKILPDLIELGIDILNPIQWRADGMDRRRLKDTYGNKLVFHGAVDNQYTLPFGTPEDVRNEVIDNIAILGRNGGYIMAPCHNIQPNTPIENIITLYEAGYETGWY